MRGRWWAKALTWLLAATVVAIIVILVLPPSGPRRGRTPTDREASKLHEARLLESLGVEPLSGVLIEPPPRSGYTGVLASLGFEGPHMRRVELAVAQLNRVGADGKSLALTVGQAVAAARSLPDGVPAHVFFSREISVPDPQVLFGHDSARELRSDNRLKEVDYYAYGDLEVGIKKGLLVEMVVH